MRRLPLLLLSAFVLVSASQSNAQILHKKKKTNKSTDATNTAEPDKQLYDKAINDIKHGRHEVGRLGLQTLIIIAGNATAGHPTADSPASPRP